MARHVSDWLHALPLTAFDLRLSDEAVRVAVGLRLGAALCEPHTCVCCSPVSARESHRLSCLLGFGRHARHSNFNDIVYRSLNKSGTPAVKEPAGLARLENRMARLWSPGATGMLCYGTRLWWTLRPPHTSTRP